jgi:hypothetical protein
MAWSSCGSAPPLPSSFLLKPTEVSLGQAFFWAVSHLIMGTKCKEKQKQKKKKKKMKTTQIGIHNTKDGISHRDCPRSAHPLLSRVHSTSNNPLLQRPAALVLLKQSFAHGAVRAGFFFLGAAAVSDLAWFIANAT